MSVPNPVEDRTTTTSCVALSRTPQMWCIPCDVAMTVSPLSAALLSWTGTCHACGSTTEVYL